MSLLFPLGLAALIAAIVPLVIHLARRTEQRPTDFAALRWLRHKPRPRHRPKFDERLLLAIRLLLIALLALLLARPMLSNAVDTRAVIAVAPGVDPTSVPGDQAARRIWLAPGFPTLDTAAPGAVPIASLIRQLDAELPPGARLTLVVPAILTGIDAERPRLSRPVLWRIVGGAMPATVTRTRPLRVAMRGDDTRYIRAALAALNMAGDSGSADDPIPAGISALVRLAPGPLPAATLRWIDGGGTALVGRDVVVPAGSMLPVWRDEAGATLVESRAEGRGRLLRFTRALTPAAMPALVEADFPRRLAALMSPEPPPPARVAASAYRPTTGAAAPVLPARDLAPWLAIAVAALWLVERWLATAPRRRVAA